MICRGRHDYPEDCSCGAPVAFVATTNKKIVTCANVHCDNFNGQFPVDLWEYVAARRNKRLAREARQ